MKPAETQRYRFGRFEMDASERLLLLDGQAVSLEPKAFDLLLLLVSRGGHLVGKDEIMRAVWPDTFVEEGNLARNISLLRRVLAEGFEGRGIETIPKHGYRFLPEVSMSGGTETELVAERHTVTRFVTEEEVEDDESWQVLDLPTSPRGGIQPVKRSRVSTSAFVIAGLALLVVTAGLIGLWRYLNSRKRSEETMQARPTMNVKRFTASGNVLNAAVSPDGKYISTVVDENGLQSLWMREVAANTSAIKLVPPALVEYWGLTFSNDSNFIYYVTWVRNQSNAELYELPALGGTARKIPIELDSPVSFSPLGDRFAYVLSLSSKGESYIRVADLSGQILETLATRPQPEFFALYPGGPAWSPDGKFLAYGCGSSAAREQMYLFVVNVQTKQERKLSSQSWKDIGRVTWVGDGTGVAFSARDEKDAARQLWFVSYPDGAARKLTNDLDDYTSISVTADAKSLAAIQTHEKISISVAGAQTDAANAAEIFSEVGAGRERVTWTPDGHILFCSRVSGNWDIWSMNKDGSGAKQLTLDPHNDLFPAVSPDGRSIFFASDRAGVFNIWRMNVDGNDATQLTHGGMQVFPEVSADGQWVLYTENIVVEPRVWKIATAGGQPQQLTTASSTSRPIGSPDGKQIAYVYLDEKTWGMAVRPLAGTGELPRKYPFPANVSSRVFRWSPDGHGLDYIATENGASNLWLQPLDGSSPRQLTNFKSGELMSFAWSNDGQWCAYMHHAATHDVVLIKDFK